MRAVVAIPVNNEADHIVACLEALVAQSDLIVGTYGLVLLINNCCDGTEELVATFATACACPLRVLVRNNRRPSAGLARRQAMEAAAEWLEAEDPGPAGVLLTTDADSVVPPDWIARNLAAVDAGADAVAGRIVLDPGDAARLPASLHRRGRLEAGYEALLTEIGARLDPVPGDPWPTHWTTSGATLAVRLAAYRAVGGMPDLASGEDRAFADRLRAHDLRLRHDPAIVVTTSGRLDGRAIGGAAETMARRCAEPDSPCDDRLEPLGRALARVLRRRRLRRRHEKGILASDPSWVRAIGLDAATRAACLEAYGPQRRFNAFNDALERLSPRLAYRPLPPSQLPRRIRVARALVALLRWIDQRRMGMRGAPCRVVPLSERGGAVAEGSAS